MAARSYKKLLIVDAQLLQTSDRDRGMGLFLVGLLSKLPLISGQKLLFITNGRLPALQARDKELIKSLEGTMITVDFLHRGDNELFASSAATNRQRLNAALEKELSGLKNDEAVFFIPALFSSEIHPVFPSSGTTNILLFHDLIPYLYYRNYFADHEGVPRKDYAQRFREFYKADCFVTNSQTTADDLAVYFGVDPTRIVPILGAAAERSALLVKKPSVASQLKNGFVLMPSGDDFRKNNALAAQAFAELNSGLKLAISSKFSEGTKRMLSEICPDIIFTGPVSDEEFLWLLDNAKVVFFPPEYEGLGMPLIEAVEREAVIACSNIPVFIEISSQAFLFFDPKSVHSMKETLGQALAVDKQVHLTRVRAMYHTVLKNFSWPKTARLFQQAVKDSQPAGSKKRLAIFCPSPSSYSAVGKYAFEVHAELSRLFDIDYYAEQGVTAFQPTRPNILEYAADYFPASSFTAEKSGQYDHVLYNLGNSEFHLDTILNALRLPANAIVHDTRLNGIFDWLERNKFITSERRQLEALLDTTFQVKDTSCLVSLVTNQKSIFCHSNFANKALRQFVSGGLPAITQIVHPIGVPTIQAQKLGGPVVSFAGIITEDKGINMVAEIAKDPTVQIRVFGFGVLGDSPLLQGMGDNVRVIKDLSDKDFQDNLQQSDILINYRPNYHGETSRSTLEAMRHGAVVIVKDIGWYGELPDDVVVKVEGEQDIIAAINTLLADPSLRNAIAERAKNYLRKQYSYRSYAHDIAERLA